MNNIFLITLFLLNNISSSNPPKLLGPMHIHFSYKNNYTEQTIIDSFQVEDDYTPREKIIFKFKNPLHLQTPSLYRNEIFAYDEQGNFDSLEFDLTIYDDIPPQIICPDSLSYSTYSVPSKEELLINYTAIDEIEGNKKILIKEENYDQIIRTPGEHKISLTSNDSKNNITEKIISLIVKNDEYQPWFIDNIIITTFTSYYLSPQELVNKLISKQYLENKDYIYPHYISGSYIKNHQLSGLHDLTLNLKLKGNSSSFNIHLQINVLEDELNNTKKDNPSFWDYLYQLIQYVINFFKKLFSS